MNKLIKNKKGFFPAIGITLTVGTLVVIAVIIALLLVGFGVLLNFITTNIFAIGGAFLLIVSFILLSKKSVSQKFGGFLIVLSILLILIQFSGVTQSIVPGFTTLALDKADLRSSSEYLNGQQWILTVRQGGLGQYAEGIIKKDAVGDKYSGNEKPKYDFDIKLNYAKQQCEYNILTDNNAQKIYKFYYKEWGCAAFTESGATNNCNSGVIVAKGKLSSSFTCVCIGAIEQANTIGYFDSPTIVSELGISSTANGQTYSTIINTKQKIKDTLGPYAYVIWQGNLNTGRSCSSSSVYKPIYWGGEWKTFSSSKYIDYQSQLTNVQTAIYTGDYSSSSSTWATMKSSINVLNEKTDTLYSNQQTFGTIDSKSKITGAQAILAVTESIEYPVLTFYVKTDWLGIYTPVSKPQITSTSSDCFTTGIRGIIKATIKNVGDEQGNIDVWAECNSPFAAERTELNLKAGASQSITIPITASTTTTTKASCTLYAQGTVDKVSSNVNVCVNAPTGVCTPNEMFCNDKTIVQCDSTGQKLNTIKVCTSKCIRTDTYSAKCDNDTTSIIGGNCTDKLGGLIPASISTTKSCDWYDLLCSTGITQPKEVSECKYDYGLFILIIGGIIVVVAMILLLKPSNSTSKIKYVYRRRK